MYAVSAASSGPWTRPARKSAHVCGVPSSAGSAAETYTVTDSPVLAVVAPPTQLIELCARRADESGTPE